MAATTALGAVAWTTFALPQAGSARATHRADLVVSKGSVRSADGTLTGSFVVKNSGRARAGRSSAALTVRAAGRNRLVKRFAVARLNRSASLTVEVKAGMPSGLPAGVLALRVCADSRRIVRERSETNNCRGVGTLEIADPGTGGGGPAGPGPGPGPGTPATPPATDPAPASSVPADPVPFTKDTVFTLDSPQSRYWVYVPNAYDSTHATPITLFVWLHGCGGESQYDIYTVSPGGAQSYLSIAVGGREGGCWDVDADGVKVLAAIADIKTHFNVNPRSVILGGYSSGGDLAYRTAFYNANTFAGVLAENTSPFRDTGSSRAASLAAAAWKFNVVHLAHTEDGTYPIAGVRDETDAMTAAGFPMTRIERPGTHYDADAGATGTDHDLRTYLLPHLNDGWLSP